ncbi:MAG: helix-turn-helix domain-containing protein [Selenomonas artemidis]
MISRRIKELRLENHMTQKELSDYLNLTPKMISFYELGQRVPPSDIILKLAEKFNVSTDYLLGKAKTKQGDLPPLTPKDERQIARDLENIVDSLNGAAAMSDDPEDEEDREMLKAALLHAMTLSKRMAKKKFTPKKYRHED